MATTTTVVNVDLTTVSGVNAGTSLATAVVTITDRNMSVDVSIANLTVNGLVSSQYKLRTTVTSTPKAGSGKAVTNQVTSGAGVTTVTLNAGQKYRCLKDFISGQMPIVHISVELFQLVGGEYSRIASGFGEYMAVANPAARTNQEYWGQLLVPTSAGNAMQMAAVGGVPAVLASTFTGIKIPVLWPWVETADGTFDTAGATSDYIAVLDATVASIHSWGLNTGIVINGFVPTWAIASVVSPGQLFTGVYVQGAALSGVNYQAPDDWTKLEAYVTWLCNRYGASGLTKLFTPNEPNISSQSNLTPALAALWSKHIKAGIAASTYAATIKLVAGELSLADTTYLDAMYATGNFTYDHIGYHPYSDIAGAVNLQAINERALPDIGIGVSKAGGTTGTSFTSQPAAADAFVDYIHTNHDAAASVWVAETGVASGQSAANGFLHVPRNRQGSELALVLRQIARCTGIDGVVLWGPVASLPSADGSDFGFALDFDILTPKPALAVVTAQITAIKGGTG